ncbi:hypothetical protein BDZ97DRAFT_1193158 [Flammula alnicola]|nr:hypothetical protein BDZ97DRAFT_1193158 [Flammula alnicola]
MPSTSMARLIQVALLGIFSLIAIAEKPSGKETFAVSANCGADSPPCGTAPYCCPSGLECTFHRGIPMCIDPKEPYILGYDHEPCADPYLFRCDIVLGISGFCCRM